MKKKIVVLISIMVFLFTVVGVVCATSSTKVSYITSNSDYKFYIDSNSIDQSEFVNLDFENQDIKLDIANTDNITVKYIPLLYDDKYSKHIENRAFSKNRGIRLERIGNSIKPVNYNKYDTFFGNIYTWWSLNIFDKYKQQTDDRLLLLDKREVQIREFEIKLPQSLKVRIKARSFNRPISDLTNVILKEDAEKNKKLQKVAKDNGGELILEK